MRVSLAAIKEETSTSDNTQLEDPSTDEVRGQPESDGETEDTNDMDLSAISGTKCRVPHSHEWGEKQYCNALILGVEPFELDDTPKVRVLFCNPTHRSMLPCPYFLDGNCRFSEEDCSCLCIESACLVKDSDSVWYRAMVVGLLDDHKYEVMFTNSHDVHTVDMEDILPLDNSHSNSDGDEDDLNGEDSSGDEEEEEDVLPVYLWKPSETTDVLGDWEVHTKGIGSKLMARMGYITGQGLGKKSDGRAEPVPIQLLPQGKSLDKIMELKTRAGDQDLYDVMKKEKRRKKRDAKHTAPGTTKQTPKPKNVFDFINKKLSRKKGDLAGLVKHAHQPLKKTTKINHITTGELKNRSDKHIHIQGQYGIRDKRVASQIQQKIVSAEQYLQQLLSSERSMKQHQQARSDQKKLTIF
ncbi:hypothetical protein NP493_115g02039 [Ridgeia piscesae]|uniref:Zinc finger CCCH-type with G patch domain-containing protein n=1 Tax=Ridgeia piscesae TaxID=27915 RepID=A0AAD9UH07_RIDPI|nr:hypothetical protein NP493_115g02039 [Ridgeia piscesae]